LRRIEVSFRGGLEDGTFESIAQCSYVHTLSQHVVLATTRYEVIGRILLGLDPASPII
jgi:hypothetical protein